MTDLPINISNVSAKAATNKPSSNDDVAKQDTQGFGNVLARQVADSAKPAEPPTPTSSADAAKKPTEPDNAKTTSADVASALPVDMLAALLAQQNPAAALQPEIINQPVMSAQTAVIANEVTGTTGASGTAGKKAGASLALLSENGHSSNTSMPVLDTALSKVNGTSQERKEFADTFQALDKKELSADQGSNGFIDTGKASGIRELSLSSDSRTLHSDAIGELATAAQQPVLPPLVHGTSAPAGIISTSIGTAVTQPGWGDEFSQKITWIATQHNQSAELHLNPPQLGPLDVVLKISGDQASAIFTSPHAAVRDAIEQALPKLREMLADSGIMLGNAMVSDQSTRSDQDSASRKPQGGTALFSDDTTEATRIHDTRVSTISRHNGMVDTFA
jgi:flagellar hook-length control protein FliK